VRSQPPEMKSPRRELHCKKAVLSATDVKIGEAGHLKRIEQGLGFCCRQIVCPGFGSGRWFKCGSSHEGFLHHHQVAWEFQANPVPNEASGRRRGAEQKKRTGLNAIRSRRKPASPKREARASKSVSRTFPFALALCFGLAVPRFHLTECHSAECHSGQASFHSLSTIPFRAGPFRAGRQ
jgi:hypothetical protein